MGVEEGVTCGHIGVMGNKRGVTWSHKAYLRFFNNYGLTDEPSDLYYRLVADKNTHFIIIGGQTKHKLWCHQSQTLAFFLMQTPSN